MLEEKLTARNYTPQLVKCYAKAHIHQNVWTELKWVRSNFFNDPVPMINSGFPLPLSLEQEKELVRVYTAFVPDKNHWHPYIKHLYEDAQQQLLSLDVTDADGEQLVDLTKDTDKKLWQKLCQVNEYHPPTHPPTHTHTPHTCNYRKLVFQN